MGEWFLGEIRAWACNFAPHGWVKCEGQELPVNQYSALFSLLGNSFGGKTGSTFCLPDLRGRTITSYDTATPQEVIGTKLGAETVLLVNDNVPSHAHTINSNNNPMPNPPIATAAIGCTAAKSNNLTPVGHVIGAASTSRDGRFNSSVPDVEMKPGIATISGSTQSTGGSPHNNVAPFSPITYCIATQGIYPSRE
jgi:microcystin-dependent protein